MPARPELSEVLAAELARPRPLPAQVVKHLGDAHDVSRDEVAGFLTERVPGLEDYEIDLLLSPVFTPTLEDQAAVARHLGSGSVPESEWPELIARLAARPVHAALVLEDGRTIPVPLREVTIERYVRRLRLQGSVADTTMDLIGARPAAEQPRWLAMARRAIWTTPGRRALLERYLRGAGPEASLDDAVGLLRLVETYEPADTAEFLARLPQWAQVVRHELSLASQPKPFFNDRIQDLHGGGRDRRGPENARITAREEELAQLERLRRVLAS